MSVVELVYYLAHVSRFGDRRTWLFPSTFLSWFSYFAGWLVMVSRRPILIFRSIGLRSKSPALFMWKCFPGVGSCEGYMCCWIKKKWAVLDRLYWYYYGLIIQMVLIIERVLFLRCYYQGSFCIEVALLLIWCFKARYMCMYCREDEKMEEQRRWLDGEIEKMVQQRTEVQQLHEVWYNIIIQ